MVYSPDRLLYPMKRVDFDPNGNRNHKNRGIAGYERISWDEALNIVSNKLLKIKNDYGPESIWPYFYAGTMGLLQRDSINRFRHEFDFSGQYSTICNTLWSL